MTPIQQPTTSSSQTRSSSYEPSIFLRICFYIVTFVQSFFIKNDRPTSPMPPTQLAPPPSEETKKVAKLFIENAL